MDTKKKTGLGIAAAAAAALAISAGTLATFSDTEDGQVVRASGGTMNLVVGDESGAQRLLTAEGIAPGYKSDAQTLSFTNTGNIDGSLELDFIVDGSENGCAEPEKEVEADLGCDANSELVNTLQVQVTYPGVGTVGPFSIGTADGAPAPAIPLAAGETTSITVVFTLPSETVGNEVMTDTALVDVNATLTQADANNQAG